MKFVGFAHALLASFMWGIGYTIDQKILEKGTPIQILLVNGVVMLVGVLVLFIVSPASSRSFIAIPGKQLVLILTSAVITFVATYLILVSIKFVGSSYASMLEISYPFFVVLFSAIVYRQTITPGFFVGSLLIFFGSFILVRSS